MSIGTYVVDATFEFTKPVKGSKDVLMRGKITQVKQNQIGQNSVVVVMRLTGQPSGTPTDVIVKIYDFRTYLNSDKEAKKRKAAARCNRESAAYEYLSKVRELQEHVPKFYGKYGVKREKTNGLRLCIVLENCDGESAAEVVKSSTKSSFKSALVSLVDLFHQKGISHGDIANPGNYKVKTGPRGLLIKVLDWDSAIIKPAEEDENNLEGRFLTQAGADQSDIVILCGHDR
jgi:serine/threonine protein kinase